MIHSKFTDTTNKLYLFHLEKGISKIWQIRLPLLCGSIACFNAARSLNKWEQLCTNHKWPCSFTLINFIHENELFQRGWGVFVTLVEIPEGLGGSSFPYKNGKSTVVQSEIPSMVGGLNIFWNHNIKTNNTNDSDGKISLTPI